MEKLRRRCARYNSSMMDANLLGKGKPLYWIERCILDTGSALFVHRKFTIGLPAPC